MILDESLFDQEMEKPEDATISIETQVDLESNIATLPVGDKELVLRMRTDINGLTDNGFDTLHITKRTPDWYRIWFTDKDGNIANDMPFSTYDNTMYWAKIALQGEEDVEEVVKESVVSGDLKESSTSRIYQHLTKDKNWAIISPYKDYYSTKENKGRMNKLKSIVRKDYGLGFNEFLSKWVYNDELNNKVSTDEASLLIPNMTKEQAIKLGKEFEQSSVIVNDKDGCQEICTTPFENYSVGDVVRTYNIDGDTPMNISKAEEIFANREVGPVSKAKKGGKPFKLSEVYEVSSPRSSYFQTEPTCTKIFEAVKDDDVEFTEEPTRQMISNDYQNQLITLINGEWDTIKDYNNLVNSLLETNDSKYVEFIPVIEGIIKDEHNHIGNLHNVLDRLNPNSDKDMEEGSEEADEILDK